MNRINFDSINANRAHLQRDADSQRVNDVARTANQLQREQQGLSRSEALRVAEIMVARQMAGHG